jgi:hypothetical protein
MKQICQQCRWFDKGDSSWSTKHPPACYFNGKWQRWLKKKEIDKPNACPNFEPEAVNNV